MEYSFKRKNEELVEFSFVTSLPLAKQVVLIDIVCDSVLHFAGSKCSTSRYLTDYFTFQAVVDSYTTIDLSLFKDDDTYEFYKEFNETLYSLIDEKEIQFINDAIDSKLDYEYRFALNQGKLDELFDSFINFINSTSEKLSSISKDDITSLISATDKFKDPTTIAEYLNKQTSKKNE